MEEPERCIFLFVSFRTMIMKPSAREHVHQGLSSLLEDEVSSFLSCAADFGFLWYHFWEEIISVF